MTTITAKVIADSVSYEGVRLTTMQLRYPRPIHSEFMTHRVFSRNASSSRAIPVSRLIQDVIDDPFVPLHWGRNEKGMQAGEECEALVNFGTHSAIEAAYGVEETSRERAWLIARDLAVASARAFAEAGYHKQLVNRLLEPFAHINVVCTSTSWTNFFHLRDHPDAEPHIAILTRKMKMALDGSKPEILQPGEWHLPYVTKEDLDFITSDNPFNGIDRVRFEDSRKLSVARCASVSYKTVDGQPMTVERATDLYDKLFASKHWSPFEHQATPDTRADPIWSEWDEAKEHGNFRGWRQFRKILETETR